MTRAPRLLVAALLTFASPLLASSLPSRPTDALVHDLSGTLSPETVADLERRADAVSRAGAAVAVLVRLDGADSDDTRSDARRLLSAWGVEREPGREDGVVILVNLRKRDQKHGAAAIVAGKWLARDRLPSREVERIWREAMRPALREGRIAEGIGAGLDAVERTLREGPPPPSPRNRAAAELATGILLPVTLAAGFLGIYATARLSRRGTPVAASAEARDTALGAVRGGVLARRRIADGVAIGGLLDLAARGAVTLEAGPGETLLVRPTGQAVRGPFEAGLLAIVSERARPSGVADLGTASWAGGRLGKALPALRSELVDGGLLDPLAKRRSARAAVGASLLIALAAVLVVAAAVGGVAGPAIASLMTFGSGFALLVGAATLPETTAEGDREGQAWRTYLAELAAPSRGPVDLDTAIPFLLAAGRSDLVSALAKAAATSGLVPRWLAARAGGDGAEVVGILSALVATSDGSSAVSCSDGGASAGETF